MRRRDVIGAAVSGLAALGLAAIALPHDASAQQPKPKRIGVVLLQGGTWYAAVEGLREGLMTAGLEEGRHFELVVRDSADDVTVVEALARDLEHHGVDLIVAINASVALATKRATRDVPVVFAMGPDPVASGLVDSIPRPGGRLTGVYFGSDDLTAKRLQILREIMPALRRVVTFYHPNNPVARRSIVVARDAARFLGIDLVERHVTSAQEFWDRLSKLSAADAEAFFFIPSAFVTTQAAAILERTTALRMPAIGHQLDFARMGAVAAYGVNYHDVGRQAASHVNRILGGARPGDLPVEAVSRITLVINLKAATALGLTIPPSILLRADEVIE